MSTIEATNTVETFTLPLDNVAAAFIPVSIARAKDPARPILESVCIEFHGDGATFVATDSYVAFYSTVGADDIGHAGGVKVYGYRDRNGNIRCVTLSKAMAQLNAKMNGGVVVWIISYAPDGAVSGMGGDWREMP